MGRLLAAPQIPNQFRLGQAEAKNGGKVGRSHQPVWPLPFPSSLSPLPVLASQPGLGLGLGFWVEQQHYGINHHHHLSLCVVAAAFASLFQGLFQG